MTGTTVAQDARVPVEVADDVVAVLNGAGRLGRANSTILLDGGDAVVIDTMLTTGMAASITAEVARRGAATRLVVNTHNHLDHLGGNPAFPDAEILAHPTTGRIVTLMAAEPRFLPGMLAHFGVDAKGFTLTGPTTTDLDHAALPGGARIRAFLGAHSPADLTVWLPGSRVLVTGDLCSHGVTPLARHGNLAGWAAALDELSALDPTVVVPGHGPVATVDALHACRDYLRAVRAAAADLAADHPDAVRALVGTLEGRPDPAAAALVAEAADRLDAGPVAEWAEPERTRINLVVGVAEVTGTPLSLKPAAGPPPGGSAAGDGAGTSAREEVRGD